MGIRTEWVGYGRSAAEALRAAVAGAKGDDPLAAVTVVVPSNHVGVAARRLLASGTLGPVAGRGQGIAAVTFLTVYRLGELLGSARLAGAGRRPVSTPVIAAALRAALAKDPGVFEPVASHPATEMALVSAYRELRDLSAGALDALSGQSRRAADVVRLHLDARSRLLGDWYDEEDLLDAAAEGIRVDGAVADALGTVVVHLPERITCHGAALLAAVAARRDVVVLAGTTGDTRADADVIRSVGRLGGTPTAPSKVTSVLRSVGPDRTRIVTVSDADEEVRDAVRAVVAAARAGTPLDRVALLFGTPQPYARLAYEQLAAAGIAQNGTAVMPLSARVAGRTLLGLLALPDGGFRREDVFAWLAGAPLRHQGRPIPLVPWEHLSRTAGVVSGRDQWDRRMALVADEADQRAARAEEDPDSTERQAERSRTEAQRARQLRAFVLALIDDLTAAAAAPRPWEEHATWARRQLDNLLGGDGRRDPWPVAEQRAAERVERALDRLAALGSVEGPVGLDVFGRTLELELDADLGRVGRIGEGVFVGPLSMGVGLDLDLVVVLGLAEGVLPAAPREDSLLPDRERQATGDELPRRAEAVERHHREFLAALAGASRQVLCVPRGNLRQSEDRVASRWALDVASDLAGERWWSEQLFRERRDWLSHVASFDAGLRASNLPATDQEYRLRALMAAGGSVVSTARALGDAALAQGAVVVSERRGSRFSRFDGNLAGLPVPSPAVQIMSPTRLESWAGCPFAYLMRHLLKVDEVENPEEEVTITAADRGSLVHEVLEDFIGEVLERPDGEQPAPDQPWSDDDLALLLAIADRVCDRFEAEGRTGRPVFWQRDRRRIKRDLTEVLERDNRQRAEWGTRPRAAELAFGFRDDTVGPAELELPDGRRVGFRGKADRLDIGDDGTLHVVDYKTGSITGYRGLSEADPDHGGRKLQLVVYGQAARAHQKAPDVPVYAQYWFVSAKGGYERIGYWVTPEVLQRVGETLGRVVAGIEAGVFCHYPSAATVPWVECPYCDPDGLGVGDLRRAWERKQADPAIGPFLELVAPELEGDGPGSDVGDGEGS